MSQRRSVAVPAAAVLSVAGFGGDEGLTTQEYVAKADAICLDTAKKQAAVEKGITGGTYGAAFNDEKFLSRYNAVTRNALKRLSALDAPEEERKAVANVLAAVKEQRRGRNQQLT